MHTDNFGKTRGIALGKDILGLRGLPKARA